MNKKMVVLFICFISLFLISAVGAADNVQANSTLNSEYNTEYPITSDLSNNDIQFLFDNAVDGDTFKFISEEYKNTALVVDKKLNIVSEVNSVVYASNKVPSKAKNLGITKIEMKTKNQIKKTKN